MDTAALVRIRLGLVHLETNRDFLQIPGTYPDEEDMEDEETIKVLKNKSFETRAGSTAR